MSLSAWTKCLCANLILYSFEICGSWSHSKQSPSISSSAPSVAVSSRTVTQVYFSSLSNCFCRRILTFRLFHLKLYFLILMWNVFESKYVEPFNFTVEKLLFNWKFEISCKSFIPITLLCVFWSYFTSNKRQSAPSVCNSPTCEYAELYSSELAMKAGFFNFSATRPDTGSSGWYKCSLKGKCNTNSLTSWCIPFWNQYDKIWTIWAFSKLMDLRWLSEAEPIATEPSPAWFSDQV